MSTWKVRPGGTRFHNCSTQEFQTCDSWRMTCYWSGVLEKQFRSPSLLIPVFITNKTKKTDSEFARRQSAQISGTPFLPFFPAAQWSLCPVIRRPNDECGQLRRSIAYSDRSVDTLNTMQHNNHSAVFKQMSHKSLQWYSPWSPVVLNPTTDWNEGSRCHSG